MPGKEKNSTKATSVNSQLAQSIENIGFTRTHKMIILLLLCGGIFDAIEQNTIGLVGPSLKEAWGTTATQLSFLNTVTFGAMAIGQFYTGFLADKFGRRINLTVNLLIFSLGAIICAFAPNFTVLAVGRLVVGLGLGGEVALAVTMLSEFSPNRFRASAVSMFNVGAGGIGNIIAPGFGALVIGYSLFGSPDTSWRWLFGFLIIPALLVLFYRRYVPETPRYLVSKGKVDEANKVLSKLEYGKLKTREDFKVKPFLHGDFTKIGQKKEKLINIFRGKLGRNTTIVSISLFMTMGSQVTILTLMPTILVARGFEIGESLIFTLLMNIGSLLGALGAAFAGYSLRRKMTLIPGAVVACIAALAFGFFSVNIPLIIILGMVFQFFVYLMNTTLWLYSPELYPTRLRGSGTGFILTIGGLGPTIMPLIGGYVFDHLGQGGLFTLLTCMYLFVAVILLFVPETFGRSLEKIDAEYESRMNSENITESPNTTM